MEDEQYSRRGNEFLFEEVPTFEQQVDFKEKYSHEVGDEKI